MCAYPKLIAAYHVLHRLLMPRHSPCALCSLTFACLLWPITSSTAKFTCSRTKVLLTAQIFCLLVLKPTKLHNLSFVIKTLYNHHKEYLFLACCILYTLIYVQFSKNIERHSLSKLNRNYNHLATIEQVVLFFIDALHLCTR